jgi:putative ABC transport system permease protein
MKFWGFFTLALHALWSNKGRNLLTMSGVTIGVFALTLIVALGQGLNAVITDTIASDGNLRQIRLLAGTGADDNDTAEEVEIIGEMSDARRMRLRRSAMNRRREGRGGRSRVTTITDEAMRKLSQLDHIQSIQPIITERYRVSVDDFTSPSVVSYGVDVDRRRYHDRVMTGHYFSSNRADEVILHEYLLYKWGLVQPQDQERLLGKTLSLGTIDNAPANSTLPEGLNPQLAELASELSLEEKAALQGVLPKLMERFANANATRKRASRKLKVVGILREFQTGEPFNVVEDTNSAQADVYLPLEVARELYLSTTVNAELGYSSAIVIVDDAQHVAEVEQTLKDVGYTAFSVVGVLHQIETTLTVITVVVSFLTGIALLVSMLGIINTMITSVLERTREIGIYKSVGASDFQVMGMFLMESALIGLLGGLLGLSIAALATVPGNRVAAYLIADRMALGFEGTVFEMPLWLIVGGPILGTIVAVLAAWVPARNAARIDPVKALRHD